MNASVPVAAVDFGAASIRVCRIDVAASNPVLEVVHRVSHQPRADASGVLRWDWDRLVDAMLTGIRRVLELGPVASIGIDTWGVDYGLVDAGGALVEPPVSYRDRRTAGYRDVVDRVGAKRLYDIAGLQLMPINTIFQLASHDPAALARAAHVVMLPELLAWHLTGRVTAELTSAGTTGLLDVTTGGWSNELLDAIGLRPGLLPAIERPGSLVGHWEGVPVHLVGGHDTASAVLAGGGRSGAFVSAGTWLLVGREQEHPDVSAWARDRSFTNEQGAAGGIRLLRNVAGWWLVEECRRTWGDSTGIDELLAAAAAAGPVPTIDATDERFLAPADMPAELAAAAGLADDADRATIVRCAVESMAAATATICADLDAASVSVFGGGSRAPLYLDALADRGLDVATGPVEATALGNAMSQALTLGVFDSVAAARDVLAERAAQADQGVTGKGSASAASVPETKR